MQHTITLAKPISLNGITVNQVTLREPTVGDHLAARKMASGDDEQFELHMLANLVGASPQDLHQLTLRDYKQLQKAYLRLSAGAEPADSQQPAVVADRPLPG